LCDCGYNKPVTSLDLDSRSAIIKAVCLHRVLLVSKAEMDQFRDGVESAKALWAFREHPEVMTDYFVKLRIVRLTVGM